MKKQKGDCDSRRPGNPTVSRIKHCGCGKNRNLRQSESLPRQIQIPARFLFRKHRRDRRKRKNEKRAIHIPEKHGNIRTESEGQRAEHDSRGRKDLRHNRIGGVPVSDISRKKCESGRSRTCRADQKSPVSVEREERTDKMKIADGSDGDRQEATTQNMECDRRFPKVNQAVGKKSGEEKDGGNGEDNRYPNETCKIRPCRRRENGSR